MTAFAQVKVEQLDVQFLNDFVLEPTKNEVFVEPSETAVRKLAVTNRTENTVTFVVEIEDITGSDNPEEQIKLLGDEYGPYSLRDYLTPEVNTFTLAPGQRITIPITVSLPSDAAPGGYYGALIVSTEEQTETLDDGTQVAGVTRVVTRVGSLFLVRVAGDVLEESSLSTFKPLGPERSVYTNHPEGFEVAVKNEGSVHLVHYGEVTVTNMFGKTVAQLPVHAFFSLPEATRFKDTQWPASFSFGYYTAALELHKGYGDEQSLHTAQLTFWVLPWHIILPLLIVIILLITVLRYIKKNFKVTKRR